MTRTTLPDCAMLWIGGPLSAVERACMRSVLRQGHRLTLYSYDPIDGVPEGVSLADAAGILPRSAIVAHHSGSVALFSDWFRMVLLQRGLGLWLDSDIYLLAPLKPDASGNLFGRESSRRINGAVLGLPPTSPLIAPVLRLFEAPYVPDWLDWTDRLRAGARYLRQGRVDLARLPWGVAGPLALTALARRHGLDQLAAAPEVYSPWTWQQACWICDPAQQLDQFITPHTRALHLFNQLIAAHKHSPARSGSFLHRLQQEGA